MSIMKMASAALSVMRRVRSPAWGVVPGVLERTRMFTAENLGDEGRTDNRC